MATIIYAPMNIKNLSYDGKIWFPFTRMPFLNPPRKIIKGSGIYLYDDKENRYVDAISSWWVNLHGHCHPDIVQALQRQSAILEHVSMTGFINEPAEELADSLLKILPGNFSKIFYSDNGSTSVEAALRMAMQYHINEQRSDRTKIISIRDGYHGDTLGAFSAARNDFNRLFHKRYFNDTISINLPTYSNNNSLNQLKYALRTQQIAAFIFEPSILGAGGMKTYPNEILDELIALCRKENVITIADEVLTGFGRTGPLFACERLQNYPDIICLSKGITGGFLPLGVTACNEEIFQSFFSELYEKTLFYGHSFTGNPLSCACANAGLRLVMSEHCTQQRLLIQNAHTEFISSLTGRLNLKRSEVMGTILILEYNKNINPEIVSAFLQRGIFIRPLGNVLYVMPPYCITEPELNLIYQTITTLTE